MFTVAASNVFISKGYENEPALKFSENGESVQFNIGWKVYDSKAENNSRWINHHIKAFGQVCARIKKMNLKEGSCVNISGRLDEDVWNDRNTGEKKKRFVVILDSIEFAYTGSKSKDAANGTEGGVSVQDPNAQFAGPGGQMAPGMMQMAAPGGYAQGGYVQGYAPQPQTAPQAAPQNASQGYANQQAAQAGYAPQPQQAQQNAPQSTPKPVGTAADFAGFEGYTPYAGSNMFPT